MSVRVKLKAGHPHRNMRARLSDGRVLEIDEKGVELTPELVSGEMRRCGWFLVSGKAGAKQMPNTETRRDEDTEGKSSDEPSDQGGKGDDDLTQGRGGAEEKHTPNAKAQSDEGAKSEPAKKAGKKTAKKAVKTGAKKAVAAKKTTEKKIAGKSAHATSKGK